MSTPLFVRTPSVGSPSTVLGASLAAYAPATPMIDLTAIAAEATMVEAVAWCAQKFSTQAGMLVLALSDGTDRRLVGSYAIDAGTATEFASGRIELDVTIPVGFKLVAAHNTEDSGSAFTNLDLTVLGGVVR